MHSQLFQRTSLESPGHRFRKTRCLKSVFMKITIQLGHPTPRTRHKEQRSTVSSREKRFPRSIQKTRFNVPFLSTVVPYVATFLIPGRSMREQRAAPRRSASVPRRRNAVNTHMNASICSVDQRYAV